MLLVAFFKILIFSFTGRCPHNWKPWNWLTRQAKEGCDYCRLWIGACQPDFPSREGWRHRIDVRSSTSDASLQTTKVSNRTKSKRTVQCSWNCNTDRHFFCSRGTVEESNRIVCIKCCECDIVWARDQCSRWYRSTFCICGAVFMIIVFFFFFVNIFLGWRNIHIVMKLRFWFAT